MKKLALILVALCVALSLVGCSTISAGPTDPVDLSGDGGGTIIIDEMMPQIELTGSPGERFTLEIGVDTRYSGEIQGVEFVLRIPGRYLEVSTETCESCPITDPCLSRLQPFGAEVRVDQIDMNTLYYEAEGDAFYPAFSNGTVAIFNFVLNETALEIIDPDPFELEHLVVWGPDGVRESLTPDMIEFHPY